MNDLRQDEVKGAVRQRYASIALSERSTSSCCGSTEAASTGATSSCCSSSADSGGCCGGTASVQQVSLGLGYSEAEVGAVPDGANLGLGCGNPQAIASLQPGEVVLDLGSGAGFDCFLAAPQVGKRGQVIGVDMTPEMVAKARANAQQVGSQNVEFRLGEIERLPVADSTVDVIISNCVINLSPDKPAVFR